MKRIFKAIGSGILLFAALFAAIGWQLSMLLWMFVIGDTHEEVWRVLPYFCAALSGSMAIAFVRLDVMNKSSKRSRTVRLVFSMAVCLLLLGLTVHDEAARIKGWSAEDAALSVAFSLYPDQKQSFVLKVESEENVPAWIRGPNITYIVMAGEKPVCRLAVSMHYWFYWTCGMYETLKTKNPNKASEATSESAWSAASSSPHGCRRPRG